MKINLYQTDRECYFWTKEEIGFLEQEYPDFFTRLAGNQYVPFKGHEIKIIPNSIRSTFGTEFKFDADLDYCIMVEQRGTLQKSDFYLLIELIKKNPEIKFIIVAKNIEDYWLAQPVRNSDTELKELGSLPNITIIWDVDGVDYKNFNFEPKANLQNYYNSDSVRLYMFINGTELFYKIEKEYRMGIHMNKVVDKVREFLYNTYTNNTYPTLLFTSTNNKKDKVFQNYIRGRNDNNSIVTQNWYYEQFLELTTKSQMEVIYETFTTTAEFRWLLKWNEKTIKQLYLGKPFIHADPSAHSLFKPNGLTPYRSLYTDKLWDIYERYDNQNLLHLNYSESDFFWKQALEENIEWLLTMDTTEWNERISEANRVAIENKRIIEEYIFNQSLFKYVK
jgi:hypothetical protein